MSDPSLQHTLSTQALILAEGAIAEILRRDPRVELHPQLFNSPLVYGPEETRRVMTSVYHGYIEVAEKAGVPMLLSAPTWRLDRERLTASKGNPKLNTDAVNYMKELRDDKTRDIPIFVGALLGPKNDCYSPEQSLSETEGREFHSWQSQELASAGPDFLQAQTMPAVSEALGIARAMAETSLPYIVSFCLAPDGKVLDGTSLPQAMSQLDEALGERAPLGYYVNCTHPGFLLAYHPGELQRLIGIQANGSSKDVRQLDGSQQTEADPISDWANSMRQAHQEHDIPILGGCCGTTPEHLSELVRQASA